MVRQLFEIGVLASGFWHQFALTAHSPVGLNPEQYGIIPDYKKISFANNDIEFIDKTGIDHSKFSYGLKKSLFNFMHGIGFDSPLQDWFDFKIPKTQINSNYIKDCLTTKLEFKVKPSAKIVWLGSKPTVTSKIKTKKGFTRELVVLTFYTKTASFVVTLSKGEGLWLLAALETLRPNQKKRISFIELKTSFEIEHENFELFWFSKSISTLKNNGLLVL